MQTKILLQASLCTKYWLTTQSQACPGKGVIRLIDCLDMTIAVDWDIKQQANIDKNIGWLRVNLKDH